MPSAESQGAALASATGVGALLSSNIVSAFVQLAAAVGDSARAIGPMCSVSSSASPLSSEPLELSRTGLGAARFAALVVLVRDHVKCTEPPAEETADLVGMNEADLRAQRDKLRRKLVDDLLEVAQQKQAVRKRLDLFDRNCETAMEAYKNQAFRKVFSHAERDWAQASVEARRKQYAAEATPMLAEVKQLEADCQRREWQLKQFDAETEALVRRVQEKVLPYGPTLFNALSQLLCFDENPSATSSLTSKLESAPITDVIVSAAGEYFDATSEQTTRRFCRASDCVRRLLDTRAEPHSPRAVFLRTMLSVLNATAAETSRLARAADADSANASALTEPAAAATRAETAALLSGDQCRWARAFSTRYEAAARTYASPSDASSEAGAGAGVNANTVVAGLELTSQSKKALGDDINGALSLSLACKNTATQLVCAGRIDDCSDRAARLFFALSEATGAYMQLTYSVPDLHAFAADARALSAAGVPALTTTTAADIDVVTGDGEFTDRAAAVAPVFVANDDDVLTAQRRVRERAAAAARVYTLTCALEHLCARTSANNNASSSASANADDGVKSVSVSVSAVPLLVAASLQALLRRVDGPMLRCATAVGETLLFSLKIQPLLPKNSSNDNSNAFAMLQKLCALLLRADVTTLAMPQHLHADEASSMLWRVAVDATTVAAIPSSNIEHSVSSASVSCMHALTAIEVVMQKLSAYFKTIVVSPEVRPEVQKLLPLLNDARLRYFELFAARARVLFASASLASLGRWSASLAASPRRRRAVGSARVEARADALHDAIARGAAAVTAVEGSALKMAASDYDGQVVLTPVAGTLIVLLTRACAQIERGGKIPPALITPVAAATAANAACVNKRAANRDGAVASDDEEEEGGEDGDVANDGNTFTSSSDDDDHGDDADKNADDDVWDDDIVIRTSLRSNDALALLLSPAAAVTHCFRGAVATGTVNAAREAVSEASRCWLKLVNCVKADQDRIWARDAVSILQGLVDHLKTDYAWKVRWSARNKKYASELQEHKKLLDSIEKAKANNANVVERCSEHIASELTKHALNPYMHFELTCLFLSVSTTQQREQLWIEKDAHDARALAEMSQRQQELFFKQRENDMREQEELRHALAPAARRVVLRPGVMIVVSHIGVPKDLLPDQDKGFLAKTWGKLKNYVVRDTMTVTVVNSTGTGSCSAFDAGLKGRKLGETATHYYIDKLEPLVLTVPTTTGIAAEPTAEAAGASGLTSESLLSSPCFTTDNLENECTIEVRYDNDKTIFYRSKVGLSPLENISVDRDSDRVIMLDAYDSRGVVAPSHGLLVVYISTVRPLSLVRDPLSFQDHFVARKVSNANAEHKMKSSAAGIINAIKKIASGRQAVPRSRSEPIAPMNMGTLTDVQNALTQSYARAITPRLGFAAPLFQCTSELTAALETLALASDNNGAAANRNGRLIMTLTQNLEALVRASKNLHEANKALNQLWLRSEEPLYNLAHAAIGAVDANSDTDSTSLWDKCEIQPQLRLKALTLAVKGPVGDAIKADVAARSAHKDAIAALMPAVFVLLATTLARARSWGEAESVFMLLNAFWAGQSSISNDEMGLKGSDVAALVAGAHNVGWPSYWDRNMGCGALSAASEMVLLMSLWGQVASNIAKKHTSSNSISSLFVSGADSGNTASVLSSLLRAIKRGDPLPAANAQKRRQQPDADGNEEENEDEMPSDNAEDKDVNADAQNDEAALELLRRLKFTSAAIISLSEADIAEVDATPGAAPANNQNRFVWSQPAVEVALGRLAPGEPRAVRGVRLRNSTPNRFEYTLDIRRTDAGASANAAANERDWLVISPRKGTLLGAQTTMLKIAVLPVLEQLPRVEWTVTMRAHMHVHGEIKKLPTTTFKVSLMIDLPKYV